MTTTVRVSVDREKCCGYAVCVDVCPEVFALDDDGFAVVKHPVIGPDLYDQVGDAAASCPEGAILVEQAVSQQAV